ncbi:MAG: MFS transporter [Lachnospiraceae bacterium]|nr:MFS transporter [Lachnospiraceae bacterium]
MKLNNKKTIYVGFAFFLICLFWQSYDSLIPKILVDKFGMNQTLSGFIMALDNIFALFMLPLFGTLSDKTKSKYGKRTPYILIGTILAAVFYLCLSFVDGWQKNNIADVDIDNPNALATLYDADLEFKMPDDSRTYKLKEKLSREEFLSIEMYDKDGNINPDYTNYVVPVRQSYAWKTTKANPATLVTFIALLLLVLISMSTFRSPAVALMPDVTIKPLRSKANAIINLLGTSGGILVLVMGIIFKTGKAENALMSYIPYFSVVICIMLVSLLIFKLNVNEPKFVEEMKAESKLYGIEEDAEEENNSHKLSKEERKSLYLILASVILWFFGYNAVTSKYSVYAGNVLNVDFNTTLLIGNAAAIVSYIPVGMVSSKLGRKKVILGGVVILAISFFAASFLRAGTPAMIMNLLFALAGIGWASINVNSFPMVVELASGSDIGKYTGFYYTASMAAQTLTPIISGVFLDIRYTTLFPYATIFVVAAFFTMLATKHGDSKPDAKTIMENISEMGD